MMDYGKIKSPEKFRAEIIKAKKIKSFEQQKSRLNLIQLRIYDLIKAKRKVKLLSSEGDKRILAVLEEIYKENITYLEGFKKNQSAIKNIIGNKIKPENLRVKTDYIVWHGTKEELVKLIKGLKNKEYIINFLNTKVYTAIKEHFYIDEYERELKNKPVKIQWGKTKPLLVHLFDLLYKKGFLKDDFYCQNYKFISDHFLSKEGKHFTNKQLRKEYDEAPKTYGDAPLGHNILEKDLNEILNEKP